jgi:hypothetical protein
MRETAYFEGIKGIKGIRHRRSAEQKYSPEAVAYACMLIWHMSYLRSQPKMYLLALARVKG